MLTTVEAEDAVSELLATMLGVAVAAYFNLETQTSHVSVFMDQGKFVSKVVRDEIAAGLKRIKGFGLDIGPGEIEIARVKREDWAESWKRHFKPIIIRVQRGQVAGNQGKAAARPAVVPQYRSLLVKPSWSKRRPAKNQPVVILDPGLSFGTGQHPTTSFCLHEITRCLGYGTKPSFLDIGTGSGILAIAAAKLGYTPVHAFDFDPDAVRVAHENIRKNKVTGRIQLTRGDVTKLSLRPARQYDVVCANLISNLLINERCRIVKRMKPGGTLVLAGILASEFAEVERAFASLKLKLHSRRVEKEWCSGSFCFI